MKDNNVVEFMSKEDWESAGRALENTLSLMELMKELQRQIDQDELDAKIKKERVERKLRLSKMKVIKGDKK